MHAFANVGKTHSVHQLFSFNFFPLFLLFSSCAPALIDIFGTNLTCRFELMMIAAGKLLAAKQLAGQPLASRTNWTIID